MVPGMHSSTLRRLPAPQQLTVTALSAAPGVCRSVALHVESVASVQMGAEARNVEFLSGWKEIAKYLGQGVRTVQRYESELGLPIHRLAAKSEGSVITTKAELDAWVAASGIRAAFPSKLERPNRATLNQLREQVAELHRLRLETSHLRTAL